jgi:uncharacterized protein (TIGR01777 family)
MKVVLAGGTGAIGTALISRFRAHGADVTVLTRAASLQKDGVQYVHWDGRRTGPWMSELNHADLLINLSGKSVNCRYSPEAKAEIIRSRIDSTLALGAACIALSHPPKCWINLASATLYADAMEHPWDENGTHDTGFSAEVCEQWEQTFLDIPTPATRKVIFRTAFFLSRSGSVLQELATAVRLGLGGKWGKRDPMVSWIHEEDFFRMVKTAYDDEWEGIFNASSPGPVPLSHFFNAIRRTTGPSFGLPVPEFLVHVGCWLKRTEPELISKSRYVIPVAALNQGFRFHYSDIRSAMTDLLTNQPSAQLSKWRFVHAGKRSSFLPYVSRLF